MSLADTSNILPRLSNPKSKHATRNLTTSTVRTALNAVCLLHQWTPTMTGALPPLPGSPLSHPLPESLTTIQCLSSAKPIGLSTMRKVKRDTDYYVVFFSTSFVSAILNRKCKASLANSCKYPPRLQRIRRSDARR